MTRAGDRIDLAELASIQLGDGALSFVYADNDSTLVMRSAVKCNGSRNRLAQTRYDHDQREQLRIGLSSSHCSRRWLNGSSVIRRLAECDERDASSRLPVLE